MSKRNPSTGFLYFPPDEPPPAITTSIKSATVRESVEIRQGRSFLSDILIKRCR